MATYTLYNNFHNADVAFRGPAGLPDPWGWVQEQALEDRPGGKARLRRIRRALCRVSDCACGTVHYAGVIASAPALAVENAQLRNALRELHDACEAERGHTVEGNTRYAWAIFAARAVLADR